MRTAHDIAVTKASNDLVDALGGDVSMAVEVCTGEVILWRGSRGESILRKARTRSRDLTEAWEHTGAVHKTLRKAVPADTGGPPHVSPYDAAPGDGAGTGLTSTGDSAADTLAAALDRYRTALDGAAATGSLEYLQAYANAAAATAGISVSKSVVLERPGSEYAGRPDLALLAGLGYSPEFVERYRAAHPDG